MKNDLVMYLFFADSRILKPYISAYRALPISQVNMNGAALSYGMVAVFIAQFDNIILTPSDLVITSKRRVEMLSVLSARYILMYAVGPGEFRLRVDSNPLLQTFVTVYT